MRLLPKNSSSDDWTNRVAFGFCLIIAFGISWYFHDKFYWGPDDGFYAYISQRMLEGDVVHRDIQALHPGLLYFINTAFLGLTNGDVVSLRYPLIALTVIQSALAYKLTRPYGIWSAIVAAIAMIAFGFIQFVNPTPNWYLLTIAIGLGTYLITADLKATRTLIWIGAIVGVAFLLRQLTGVFLAMAVTAILFLDRSNTGQNTRQFCGSIVLSILAICLSVFIFSTANTAGFVLFGFAPPLILFVAAVRVSLGWKEAGNIVSRLLIGALIVALPLLIYHLATGSFSGWVNETFIVPFTFFQVPLVDKASYFALIYYPVTDIASGNLLSIFSLLFWTFLLIINLVLSILILRRISAGPSKSVIFGILVVFHSLVALIYEIPIYLFYTSGLILVGLLFFNLGKRKRMALTVLTLALSVFATGFQAGQPLDRTYSEIALNKRVDWASHPLPTTRILTNKATSEFYQNIINAVNVCTLPSDKLFAYPQHPEIYFLTRRQATFYFLNSTFGISPSTDIEPYVETVESSNQPALIIHNTKDPQNTVYSDNLFAAIRHLYTQRGQIEELTIYQRTGHSLNANCQNTLSNLNRTSPGE